MKFPLINLFRVKRQKKIVRICNLKITIYINISFLVVLVVEGSLTVDRRSAMNWFYLCCTVGLCTLIFTLFVFIWKPTRIFNEGEREIVPLLYFTLMEFANEEHPCWLRARVCLGTPKLQIISRIHRLVSVFYSFVNNLVPLKLGIENGWM